MAEQAQSVALPKRWPLVNQLQNRYPITSGSSALAANKDAKLVNCYAEYDTEDKEYWVYKRLGTSSATPLGPGGSVAGLGMYQPPASIYGILNVFGTTLYQNNTSLGTVNGSGAQIYSFESINSSPLTVIMNNTFKVYLVTPSLGTFTDITATIAPATALVNGVVYLDGTAYVMDVAGTIYGSNINDGTIWAGTNVIKASSNTDKGMCIAKQLSYVIALKQYTAQIFYDAGNATGSPLSAVPDAQLPLGCFGAQTVQNIDNSLLWVTSNQTVSPQVVQMDNLTPKIVSTPAVERILDNTNSDGSLLFAFVIKHAGHRFYILNDVGLNITLVYDLDQLLWYIWTDPSGNFWPYASTSFTQLGAVAGLHYVQDYSAGFVRIVDTCFTYPNDLGTVVPVDIYTPNFDAGTNRRKYLKTLYFNGDQVPGSKLLARFTDDDFQSWSNPRQVDLSEQKPRLTDCGTFIRRRAYHFRHQANTPMRIKSVDIQMDIGTL